MPTSNATTSDDFQGSRADLVSAWRDWLNVNYRTSDQAEDVDVNALLQRFLADGTQTSVWTGGTAADITRMYDLLKRASQGKTS